MSERVSIPALKDRIAVEGRDGISHREAYALVEAVEALNDLVDDYEETDPFPTSDGHPLYRARAARDRFDFGEPT